MYKQIIDFINSQMKYQYGSVTAQRKALADRLGYSQWTVTQILIGNKEPSKNFMECIADHYGKAIIYYNGQWKIVNADR